MYKPPNKKNLARYTSSTQKPLNFPIQDFSSPSNAPRLHPDFAWNSVVTLAGFFLNHKKGNLSQIHHFLKGKTYVNHTLPSQSLTATPGKNGSPGEMNRTWKPTHFHDKLEGVYRGLELCSSKQEASPNRGVNTKAFECTTVFQRVGTRESFFKSALQNTWMFWQWWYKP